MFMVGATGRSRTRAFPWNPSEGLTFPVTSVVQAMAAAPCGAEGGQSSNSGIQGYSPRSASTPQWSTRQ